MKTYLIKYTSGKYQRVRSAFPPQVEHAEWIDEVFEG